MKITYGTEHFRTLYPHEHDRRPTELTPEHRRQTPYRPRYRLAWRAGFRLRARSDEKPSKILGYCALSTAQLYLHELSEADRKWLPAWPVPAMRMGRLAIVATEQGKGYGKILLGHAVNLARSVRQTMGVRVLIVDAKDASASAFYQSYGFRPTASEALALYLPV